MKTLKLLLAFIALYLFLSVPCFSQDSAGEALADNFEVGARLGVNFHTLKGSDATGSVGGVIGLWGQKKLSKLIGLQAEVLYVEQGAERNYDFGPWYDVTVEYDINYVAVPIGLSVHPVKFIDLHGGIQPGMVVTKQVVTSDGVDNVAPLEGITSFDAAWYVGTTIKLPFWGDGAWAMTIRHRSGLMNVSSERGVELKNRGTAISVAYRIPLSKFLE